MIYKQRRDPILGPVTGEEHTWKLVVPEEYRTRVLADAHREVTAGHLGVEKTYAELPCTITGRGCGMMFISSYRGATNVSATKLIRQCQKG